MMENLLAVRAPPRTALGELTALPRYPNWWRGGWLPLPCSRTPPPLSALWDLGFGPCP